AWRMITSVFTELFGTAVARPQGAQPRPVLPPAEPWQVVGDYEWPRTRLTVSAGPGGALTLSCVSLDRERAGPLAGSVMDLRLVSPPGRAVAQSEDVGPLTAQFFDPDAGGRFRYLHLQSRTAIRLPGQR